MKLYSGPLSMFGAKTQIAMHEKGLDFELEMVPFSIRTRYEPRHPEVLRVNPKRQVPVLIDGEVEIFDSTQIFEYLEDLRPTPPLWPPSVGGRARARQLELMSDEVFFPNAVQLMSRGAATPEQIESATAAIAEYYRRMDRLVGAREYLADSYSYADIAFFMAQFFATFLGAPVPEDCEQLNEWKQRVESRQSVSRVVEPMREFLRIQFSLVRPA